MLILSNYTNLVHDTQTYTIPDHHNYKAEELHKDTIGKVGIVRMSEFILYRLFLVVVGDEQGGWF